MLNPKLVWVSVLGLAICWWQELHIESDGKPAESPRMAPGWQNKHCMPRLTCLAWENWIGWDGGNCVCRIPYTAPVSNTRQTTPSPIWTRGFFNDPEIRPTQDFSRFVNPDWFSTGPLLSGINPVAVKKNLANSYLYFFVTAASTNEKKSAWISTKKAWNPKGSVLIPKPPANKTFWSPNCLDQLLSRLETFQTNCSLLIFPLELYL